MRDRSIARKQKDKKIKPDIAKGLIQKYETKQYEYTE